MHKQHLFLRHYEDKNTIVLKHPMTPEKKLDIPRATFTKLIVSHKGLISSYDVVIGAVKPS